MNCIMRTDQLDENVYIYYSTIFMSTLYVSKDRVVRHQEFIVVYCITQLSTNVRVCPPALVLLKVRRKFENCRINKYIEKVHLVGPFT